MSVTKKIKYAFILLFGSIFFNAASAELKKIVLCTDDNFWYPFIFIKNEQVQGLHIDIINQALITQNYVAEYKSMPWAACQDAARFGQVDGIATISYDPSRATFLMFPKNAENTAKKSPWRVSQADYVVVTSGQNSAKIEVREGDLFTVPAPIRLVSSYSLVNDFQQKDIYVEQFSQGEECYQKLITEKTGSVIDLAEAALYYAALPKHAGKLFIHPAPIDSKSYYLAFAKQGTVSLQDAEDIWDAVVQVREGKAATLTTWLNRY